MIPLYEIYLSYKDGVIMIHTLLDTFVSLSSYQQDVIVKHIRDFLALNTKLETIFPTTCPICGHQHSCFIKKGFAHGKQRFLCKICMTKFVYTRGTIMFGSHQSSSKWTTVILDTLSFVPILHTAASINVHPDTVFFMRHKILMAIEKLVVSSSITLSGLIELDETYINDAYKKSTIPYDRKPRKHGESATKRGISKEKVCICAGADRNANVILCSANRAKPSKENIRSIYEEVIQKQSIIINDGVSSYLELMEEKNCREEIVPDHTYYNEVFHLNTVNNLHSQIKKAIKQYRGVSTKYLNRYLSMLTFIQPCLGMDGQEKVHYFLDKFKGFVTHFNNTDVKTYNLLHI